MKTLSFKPFGIKCINIFEMNKNLENNDWQNEYPTLANRTKDNGFSTPENYFDHNISALNNLVFLEKLKKTTSNDFAVPSNYFEDLPNQIEAKIAVDDLLQQKINAFSVPTNYFEELENKIASKIKVTEPKQTAKVIPLWKKNIFKYSSVACFIVMASFGTFYYQNSVSLPAPKSLPAEIENQQVLYDIDESTIIDHIEAQNVNISSTNSASDTETEKYILNNFSSSDLTQEFITN